MSSFLKTLTIWSETLFESLYEGLRHGRSDGRIRQLLQDLDEKGIATATILRRVEANCDAQAVARLKRVLAGRVGGKAPSGGVKRSPSKSGGGGLMGGLKKLWR